MIFRRIAYILLLAASVVAFILTDSGVALFFLVALAAYPILAYALLFVASKRVKFNYHLRESCIRGGELQITMRLGLKPRFLVGYADVVAIIDNTTFNKSYRENFFFRNLSFAPRVYNYTSADSGRISVYFKAIRLVDIFGVCAVNVRCNRYAESNVSPVIHDSLDATVGVKTRESMSGDISLPFKGNDHTEIFNIRDYAAGDSLNAVHWKLSSKFDVLKSKEFGATDDHRTLILVDLSRAKGDSVADDKQLNCVLDTAVSISNALKSGRYAHTVGWFNDGVYAYAEVADNDTFVSMVYNLMSIKVDEGNAESLFYFARTAECVVFTKVIMVTTAVRLDELKENGDLDLTVIAVGDDVGEVIEGSIKIINITSEQLGALLAAIEL